MKRRTLAIASFAFAAGLLATSVTRPARADDQPWDEDPVETAETTKSPDQPREGTEPPPSPPPGVEPAPGSPADRGTNEADKRVGVGIDGFFVLPVGHFGDVTGPLGGPITRFGYRVVLPVEISVRTGYLFALSKDQGGGLASRYDILPIWLEARWFIQNAFQGLYAAIGGGMNIYLPTLTPPPPGTAGDRVTELRRRFGGNVGLGYVLSPSLPIDLRLQAMVLNVIGQTAELQEKTDLGVSLSGGYTLQF